MCGVEQLWRSANVGVAVMGCLYFSFPLWLALLTVGVLPPLEEIAPVSVGVTSHFHSSSYAVCG